MCPGEKSSLCLKKVTTVAVESMNRSSWNLRQDSQLAAIEQFEQERIRA